MGGRPPSCSGGCPGAVLGSLKHLPGFPGFSKGGLGCHTWRQLRESSLCALVATGTSLKATGKKDTEGWGKKKEEKQEEEGRTRRDRKRRRRQQLRSFSS